MSIINQILLIQIFYLCQRKTRKKVFYLAVKAYFDEKDRKGSNERIITVITDRKKPDKPEIIISDNNEIEIKGENTVLYSAYPEKSGNIKPEYQKYSSPFKLNKYIPPGRYIIKAYSRDTAGNISDPAVDSFYISRKILFISQTAGSDSNTGTSYNSPLKTLDQAF